MHLFLALNDDLIIEPRKCLNKRHRKEEAT